MRTNKFEYISEEAVYEKFLQEMYKTKIFECGFTAIPNSIMHSSSISSNAKLCYAYMLQFCPNDGKSLIIIHPSDQLCIDEMTDTTGLDEESICNAFHELLEEQLIYLSNNNETCYNISALPEVYRRKALTKKARSKLGHKATDEDIQSLVDELIRKANYASYLMTDHWINKRDAILERDNHRCKQCKKTYLLHVHHLTYDRLGNEDDEDLITLCEDCHKRLHNKD